MNDRTKIHSFIQQKLLSANITEDKQVSVLFSLQSTEGQGILIQAHNTVLNAVVQDAQNTLGAHKWAPE